MTALRITAVSRSVGTLSSPACGPALATSPTPSPSPPGDVLSGDELRAIRLALGLSERALGRLAHYSASQISCWERGQSRIPPHVLPMLYQVLAEAFATRQAERAQWDALAAALRRELGG